MPILRGPRGQKVRLAYCTNVHPGESLAAVEVALEKYAAAVRENVSRDRPMGVGLWLAAPVAAELAAEPALARRLRDLLAGHGLVTFTLNAFPFGNFHAERVKTDVYRPSWLEEARVRYTLDAARALAALLPDGEDAGTISTLPIAWRADVASEGQALLRARARLAEVTAGLTALRLETGKRIRVLLEPEPGCVLETTGEALGFLTDVVLNVPEAKLHLGVCFDCCHQAVMGEDLPASLRRLRASGVAIGKIHLSSAVAGSIESLAPLAEPRYLHQVFADDGRRADDLETVAADPAWREARARVHFHVPIFAERFAGGLTTTRPALEAALDEALSWPDPPDLEVETYTWSVMPGTDLVKGITLEMRFALERLAARGYE